MGKKLVVLSGSSNLPLAKEICDELDVPLTPTKIERFSNENLSVQIQESVRRKRVYIVQSLYPHPSTAFVELAIMIDAAKKASAEDVCVVIPHYSYARSDKKDKPRISIAAELFARLMVEAGADRFLVMTLHSEVVQGFFRVPIDHLQGSQVVCKHIAANHDMSNAVALYDLGQDKRSGSYADALGIPIAVYDKRRIGDTEVEIKSITGELAGRDVWMFDDEIASASSLDAITNAIMKFGPASVHWAAVHGLFCGRAHELATVSPVADVTVTNTIDVPTEHRFPKLRVVSVAPLMAKGIERIHEGKSVSGLFRK